MQALLDHARAIHKAELPDDAAALERALSLTPTDLLTAILKGDPQQVIELVRPAVDGDADLSAWMGEEGAGQWLMAYAGRLGQLAESAAGDAEGAGGEAPVTGPAT